MKFASANSELMRQFGFILRSIDYPSTVLLIRVMIAPIKDAPDDANRA